MSTYDQLKQAAEEFQRLLNEAHGDISVHIQTTSLRSLGTEGEKKHFEIYVELKTSIYP